jgi:hypothetical protein
MLRFGMIGLAALGLASCGVAKPPAVTEVVGANSIEVGRYISMVAGCNDCHTAGYAQNAGKVPEAQWLLGNPIGYRGPWGTSYASNLRLLVNTMSKEAFVEMLDTRQGLPPMPWQNVKALSPANKAALYDYFKSLGPAGEAMPAVVPPGQEPTTPYENMVPVGPGGAPLGAP